MAIRWAARAAIVKALTVVAFSFAVPASALADAPAPAPAQADAPAPAAARADAPAPEFFGMQSWVRPDAVDVALMRRAGIGSLRHVFVRDLGPDRGRTRWAAYDALMRAAARERMEVIPTLLGIKRGRPHRPRSYDEWIAWTAFATAVARRYGRGGTFWGAHGDLEPMPLTAFQIWNEPNIPAYWRPAPDAAGYLRLVRATRKRLRAVDPSARIVLAGLPDSRLGTPALDYLRALYARPGARSLFDVVALNPYSRFSDGVMRALNRTRNLMDRRGDTKTPLWITEIGWSTDGPRSQFRTTRLGQAARIHYTLTALIAARERLLLERVTWFGLQDRDYGTEEKPWWGPRVGLFDVEGRPKPGWRTYVGFTGGDEGGPLRSISARPADAY